MKNIGSGRNIWFVDSLYCIVANVTGEQGNTTVRYIQQSSRPAVISVACPQGYLGTASGLRAPGLRGNALPWIRDWFTVRRTSSEQAGSGALWLSFCAPFGTDEWLTGTHGHDLSGQRKDPFAAHPARGAGVPCRFWTALTFIGTILLDQGYTPV